MVYFPRWKVITVLAVCVLGLIYALPNLLPAETTERWAKADLPGWLPTDTVNLGLDLRGGAHLLWGVETEAALRDRVEGLEDSIRQAFNEAEPRIGYRNLRVAEGEVRLTLRDPDQAGQARRLIREQARGIRVRVEENRIQAGYTEDRRREIRDNIVEQSIEIVRRRVNETGRREFQVQRQGESRLLVQVPGIDDPEQLKRIIGKTARMTFHLVNDSPAARRGEYGVRYRRAPVRDPAPGRPDFEIIERRVAVSGEHLTSASQAFDQQTGQPIVRLNFDSVGARKFARLTSEHVNERFAVVLDGEVISAPNIESPIIGGSGMIHGGFTVRTAQELALLLRAGALPAELTVLQERVVGPSLGADSIQAGKWAAIVSLAAVAVFVALSYGLFGLMANVALLANLVLIFALLSILQATLTLPGIAGIVLTVGMAVDANVLIFERIREELRAGRTPISAVDSGYGRALTTIIDANVTTFIAALFLYFLGSGPVQGFAVTLALGLLTSMFTAIMVTRMIVIGWLRWRRPAKLAI